MKQYIDKSAIVAEIRKRLLPIIRDKHYDEWEEGQDSERIAILDIIDTLEVKEVDLEKHLKEDIEEVFFDLNGVAVKGATHYLTVEDIKEIAKYFFELGLNAQRKIGYVPNIDDSLKELGVDPSSKEAKIFKESYCAALDKFMAQKEE